MDLWSHIIWKVGILRFLFDTEMDLLIILWSSCGLAWSLNQSLAGSALSSSDDAFLLSFFELFGSIWSFLTLSALSEGSIAFICDHSGQSRWTVLWLHSTSDSPSFLEFDHGLVFRVSPFRSFFPGDPGLPKEPASLRSIFFFYRPSLVHLYITTTPAPCQALF